MSFPEDFENMYVLLLPSTTYLYYKVPCVFVCHYQNVQTLSSPPVLELLASQGYLWLPFDLAEVIKLIGVTFKQKKYFF